MGRQRIADFFPVQSRWGVWEWAFWLFWVALFFVPDSNLDGGGRQSPANPTGGVTPRKELDRLVSGLERHPQVAILSDEIY